MEIKTKRLLLRPLRKGDEKSIVENINNLNVSKWLLVVPYPYKNKEALSWIKRNRAKWKRKKNEDYTFGIELKETEKVIGGIGIHQIDNFQKKAEVGYWLGEKYWNKGLGSESLNEIIKFGLRKLNVKRLEALVFVGNPSSGRLLEKFGFRNEGHKRKSARCKADGKIKDEYIYGLLKEDFKELKH